MPARLSPLIQKVRPTARFALVALAVGFVFQRASAEDPNPVPKVPKVDPGMQAAFARAAAGLDEFFAKWRNPPPGAEDFAVKIGLIDSPRPPGYALVRPGAVTTAPVEWFWMHNLRAESGGFAAEIGNDADMLSNVSLGDTIHFTRREIGDWMYFQNGKIVWNATACPALAHASADERRQMKEQYGIDCD